MKTLKLFFALLFLCLNLSYAQTYRVIKVAGIIKSEEGKKINRGDKINAKETLNFTNTDRTFAVAAVINLSNRRRYMMRATTKKKGTWDGKVTDLLKPSRSRAGGRSGKINTLIEMEGFLGKSDFLIMGDELIMEVNSRKLAMNEDSFFVAAFEYNDEVIFKKIEFEHNKLSLCSKDIFKVDGKPIKPDEISDFTIYYYKPSLDHAKEKVTSFNPIFSAHQDDLESELEVIFDSANLNPNAGNREEKIRNLKEDMTTYLLEVYADGGNSDVENMDKWLDQFIREKMSERK